MSIFTPPVNGQPTGIRSFIEWIIVLAVCAFVAWIAVFVLLPLLVGTWHTVAAFILLIAAILLVFGLLGLY